MNKTCDKNDICENGKNLFFTNGKSLQGDITDFDFDVLDYQRVTMPDGVTIGDVYEISKMGGLLQFYLSTTKKYCKDSDEASKSTDEFLNKKQI